MSKFHPKWEAKILEQAVVASGTWYYQNEVPYEAKLLKQKWNYGSRDLLELDAILEFPFSDYIDYNISDEGIIYYWVFSGPTGESSSSTFAAYFQARDHLDTYGYRYEISWQPDPS